jgi:hypothetical protein
MANHAITIHKVPGSRGVDTPAVPIRSGDTVTFTAEPDAPSILCLSPQTAGIISPAPVSTSIDVYGGASVSFTLGDVAPGNYCVVVQSHGWPCPGKISCEFGGSESVLLIRSAHGSDYPGPVDPPSGT